MPYFLIVIGGLFIYISIRKNKDDLVKEEPFKSVLDEKIIETELSNIKNELKEAVSRVDNLESSVLILEEKLDNMCNTSEGIAMSNDDSEKLKETIETTDNYIENSTNTMIYKLKDEGKDLDEICSTLRLGKGEVLLRLGLRK